MPSDPKIFKVVYLFIFMIIFIVGIATGYASGRAVGGVFGYDPCWKNLGDVSRESIYQKDIGGWRFSEPDIQGCVPVHPDRPWRGWRKE